MKKEIYYVVVGWNLEGCCPEDNATVSLVYRKFEDARNAMIEFVEEDCLENCIDPNIDLEDEDLDCITINNGNRGYYIQDVFMKD